MLPVINPCDGCIINVMCEQMCPKIIEYYSLRVKKRSKQEVEAATGYYWEDDYTDDNGVTYLGQPTWKKEPKKHKEFKLASSKKKKSIVEKVLDLCDFKLFKQKVS